MANYGEQINLDGGFKYQVGDLVEDHVGVVGEVVTRAHGYITGEPQYQVHLESDDDEWFVWYYEDQLEVV